MSLALKLEKEDIERHIIRKLEKEGVEGYITRKASTLAVPETIILASWPSALLRDDTGRKSSLASHST